MRVHVIRFAVIAVTLVALAQRAGAVTIRGTFRYVDKNQAGATIERPIAFAQVDILQGAIRLVGATTDANGSINITRPELGGWFAVNVYATNPGATVVSGTGGPWAAQPGESAPIWRWSWTAADVLDFTYTFHEPTSVMNYNIAETIKRAFDYANARRDPHETDVIPQIPVSISFVETPFGTRYNPPSHSLLFNASAVLPDASGLMNDFVILHEYTHYLEDMISRYLIVPSNHPGCRMAEVGVGLINNPENTWPEAFAEYLARVIPMVAPADAQLTGRDGMFSFGLSELENPGTCDAVGERNVNGDIIGPDAVEDFVAGVLWDLFDAHIDGAFGATNRDFVAGADVAIFQIFDHDLDVADYPNIRRFHDAWVARGLDHAGLDRIMDGLMPGVVADANNTIVGLTNVDLDDDGWATTPGTPAIVWGATSAANQQWTYFKGRLQNHNPAAAICLSANPFLGTLQPCQSVSHELWGFRGPIRAADGKCLERNGMALAIATCTGAANQRFELDSNGALRTDFGCVEADTNSVFVAKFCSGLPAQSWSRSELGQLVGAGNSCFTVSTTQTSLPFVEHTPVTRIACNSEDFLERWQLTGNIVHSADATCLEVPFADVWWGDQTDAATCTGAATQDWIYFAEAR